MIQQDRSPASVVTTCTECPHWQALSFDLDEARRRAANHLIVIHDVEPNIATTALRLAERRAARRAGDHS